MAYSIMLDAGHGGRDPGAVYNGRQEKDDTLALTLAVGEILQNNGIDVEYTRTTDVYETPLEKAMEANNAGVDFFVSIHRNSFPVDNEVSGVETLVYDLSGLKYQVAQDINEQLESVGFVDLGVKARPGLVVLRRTEMPAVLVEAGFINSDTDNYLFDENFDDIAQAIARGILDGLTSAGEIQNTNYRVQVGLFRNWNYAQRLENELLEQGFPAFIDDSGQYISVQVGEYQTLEEAAEAERQLKNAGYQTLIVS
ncbi:N-acetylmuramoyl-L-alanine amidase [Lachnospiraceae bacterium KGMB03038]|nr:N-acetylmuramoyl-L-alanine amidase [Lachnospiraceae bacterium KGMB03038]